MILVHGNGETHKEYLLSRFAELSKKHTVYAMDSRGHGQSAAVTEFHYSDMADDVFEFVHALDLVKPAFYGFSDGGQRFHRTSRSIETPNTVFCTCH